MRTGEAAVNRAGGVEGWRRYYELTKPRVVGLILFTAAVGMLLAIDGPIPWPRLAAGLAGIGLAAAAGAAFNHVAEVRIDAAMKRTARRPLPSGRLEWNRAFAFALGLTALSMTLLIWQVNGLTAMLTFMSLIGYAVIYTLYLKRTTPQNIVWGGAAGAAPPLLGWCAVTGAVEAEPLLLFLIIFAWTPPHFWALAIRRREEYALAGLPMLPVTHGLSFTKLQTVGYTVMLLAVSLLPYATGMSSLPYLAAAVALGLGFVWLSVRLLFARGERLAMRTFGYSIFYLTALFAALLADHWIA